MRKHLLVTMLLCAGYSLSAAPASTAEAQQVNQTAGTITGTVVDEDGEPIVGASVVAVGKGAAGAATDLDGRFTLRVEPGSTIRISYVGCKTLEVKARNNMIVTLQRSEELLDEVVVVGYGTQKKVNLTGAVSTVDVAKTMEGRPYQDVSKALQGAVPGLTITLASGELSEAANMNIRGMGTLSAANGGKPLIVVDGIEMDDISYLNPQDIASVSVLKDAASSSIYGTRAAFGVILITTKGTQKVERVTVKYTDNFGWDAATYMPEYPSVSEQLRAGIAGVKRQSGGRAEGFGMYYDEILPLAELWEQQHNGPAGYREMQAWTSDSNVGDYKLIGENKALYYANWDVAGIWFNNAAPSQSHNLTVNGTSGKTNYYMTFGYDGKEGLIKINPDKMRKYNATLNVTSQIKPWLQVGARMNFTRRVFSRPNTYWTNALNTVWRWGSWFGPWGTIDGEDFRYIADRKDARTRRTTTDFLRMTAFFKADITKDLTLNGDFTYWTRSLDEKGGDGYVYGINSWDGNVEPSYMVTKANSYTDRTNSKYNTYNFNIYANYSKSWGLHNFGAMVGVNAQGEKYEMTYVKRTKLLDLNLPQLNLATGDVTTNAKAYHKAYAGYFARLNYNYNDIYLLELNGRYDGSSSFPNGSKWAFFPSVSGGYRLSQEAYWDGLRNVANNVKIRASYGEIGNENIENYGYLSTISSITPLYTYWVNGQGGQKITMFNMPTMVASNLSWERIRTTDVGVDLGFLDNSINVTFDWYQRENANMLAPASTLPAVAGVASSPVENAGSLRTRGWELSIGWNHNFGDFNVYANASISDATTVITKWNNSSELINQNYSGKHYGDIWGFETDRYFTEADFSGKDSEGNWIYKPGVADQTGLQVGTFIYGPGDIKYADLDGNGVINGGQDGMYLYNGQKYLPDDPGYADAKKYGTQLAVGSAQNHGDLKVIGNALPRYEYSFRVGGSWKGIDLDIFFQGVGKRDAWTVSPFNFPLMRAADLTLYKHQTSYNVYDPENGIVNISESNKYPVLYAGSNGGGTVTGVAEGNNNYYPQTKYLIDMSYLRVKNITLGYTLPKDITRKAYIENARIYFSCTNPWLLHKGNDLPLDPEVNAGMGYTASTGQIPSGNASLYWGRTIPMTRTISFGLQVTF